MILPIKVQMKMTLPRFFIVQQISAPSHTVTSLTEFFFYINFSTRSYKPQRGSVVHLKTSRYVILSIVWVR